MKWVAVLAVVAVFAAGSVYLLRSESGSARNDTAVVGEQQSTANVPVESGEKVTTALPSAKIITGLAHEGQTFNNCSSVGLLIAMSHWGIKDTQKDIAEATRPWNNPKGDNDDKSVTLFELADYARAKHGLLAYVRPNGNLETLKKFVANDIPVVTRALMYEDQDIPHYRVVHGYDDATQMITQTDSINGRDKTFSYDKWQVMWKDFNYSYLIVVPPEKKELVERLLQKEVSEKVAWENAKSRAEEELAKDPDDYKWRYNLLTALYYLGDYEGTVREFEKIDDRLTRRALWYQMEPIDAYFQLGNYDRVIGLADSVINDHNKAVSELYVLKGKIYQSRGELVAARAEYEKAIYYHKHLQSAKDALASAGSQ
ncbi:MAG: Tetratricopeptide TPR_1 repeat-containing protein [Parcubacteria group bacterium GW2011_GWA2_51_10]|nr:MAG: Tetratricopeptide TPR_1 repeat-containing protein [Parcubacteria group bacterium GW2011_GWA2_51_10]